MHLHGQVEVSNNKSLVTALQTKTTIESLRKRWERLNRKEAWYILVILYAFNTFPQVVSYIPTMKRHQTNKEHHLRSRATVETTFRIPMTIGELKVSMVMGMLSPIHLVNSSMPSTLLLGYSIQVPIVRSVPLQRSFLIRSQSI